MKPPSIQKGRQAEPNFEMEAAVIRSLPIILPINTKVKLMRLVDWWLMIKGQGFGTCFVLIDNSLNPYYTGEFYKMGEPKERRGWLSPIKHW